MTKPLSISAAQTEIAAEIALLDETGVYLATAAAKLSAYGYRDSALVLATEAKRLNERAGRLQRTLNGLSADHQLRTQNVDSPSVAPSSIAPPPDPRTVSASQRVCRNCGQLPAAHGTANICPHIVVDGEAFDPGGMDITWWA